MQSCADSVVSTELWPLFMPYLQAVTDLLNNESVSDIDRLRLVMLYALRYEKENPVQLMQLFNKLASRSPKYKPGVQSDYHLFPFSLNWISFCGFILLHLVLLKSGHGGFLHNFLNNLIIYPQIILWLHVFRIITFWLSRNCS